MSGKLTPSTAPLPACCAAPAHAINETAGTSRCLKCGAEHSFDGKAWVKVPAVSPTPKADK